MAAIDSLETYPAYSFVPYPTYYLCSAHTITIKASQLIYRKHVKKKSLTRGTSKLLKTNNKGTLGKSITPTLFFKQKRLLPTDLLNIK